MQYKQDDWSLLIINEGDEFFRRHINEQATLLKGQNLSTASCLCSFQSCFLSLGSKSTTNAPAKSDGCFKTFHFVLSLLFNSFGFRSANNLVLVFLGDSTETF